MTLSSKDMLDVMAWADGELEGADADRVAALVEKDVEAKELVRSIGALGDFVREADTKAKTPDLSEQIMAKVGVPNDIERARLKRGMRTRVGAAVITLTALAAGVFLYQRSHPTVPVVGSNNDHPPTMPAAPAPTGVEVGQVEVDSSQHAVSVFYVPSEKGPETTVVWIDENQPE